MMLSRLVAGGFGTGMVPFAPGTVASATAIALGALLLSVSPWLLAAAAVAATAGGYFAIRAARVEGDPGWVVIDEIAGQFITLLSLPHVTPLGLGLAFVLFRILDITKPGPVGWADRRPGAVGIMADDVIAGLMAACLLMVVRYSYLHAEI